MAFTMAVISLAVSLFWVYKRMLQVNEEGILILAWIAFGTVFSYFIFLRFS